MEQRTPTNGPVRFGHLWTVGLVFTAALIMGLPTLRGGFVGGDDRQLVLNHVLVNHPSIGHAMKLFTIIHRDLYQPIPLLTFSAEFALAGALGLLDRGIEGASWLFHGTNVLLHAVNAGLVWLIVFQWYGGRRGPLPDQVGTAPGSTRAERIALGAALIFAVHPLQVEVVAWINGRMMLLSTLFFLAALWSQEQWLRRRGWGWATLTVALVAACGMSKVRVALPLVMVSYCVARRVRVSRGLLGLWSVGAVITALLAWVNIQATSQAGMFEGAATSLQGPRPARVAMALAWYARHYLWPTGLAAWYPSPGAVAWSDPIVLTAVAVMLPTLGLVGWAMVRWPVSRLGFGWFFLTLAATLPIIPTRGTLAADRYMYLPMVGLVWVTAAAFSFSFDRLRRRFRGLAVRACAIAPGVVVLAAMIATSWYVGSFYETYLSKTQRLADLFPQTPHVWERVAWSYVSLGAYDQAIATARKELVHDDPELRSDVFGVIGLAQIKMGDLEEGLASLAHAVDIAPENLLARHRLARALADAGRIDPAVEHWDAVVKQAPGFNPAVHGLAAACHDLGRTDRARELYRQALANNPYDVVATLGLAQMDIEAGTPDSLGAAESRLDALLEWMPENTAARTNLGVVLARLGDVRGAARVYRQVLDVEADNVTALINLAEIYAAGAEPRRAIPLLRAASDLVATLAEATAIHDGFAGQGLFGEASEMWRRLGDRKPSLAGVAGEFEVWARLCAAHNAQAATRALADARAELQQDTDAPLPLATAALASLTLGRGVDALDYAQRLSGPRPPAVSVRKRLLGALSRFDEAHPNRGWTFCIASVLVLADGSIDAAKLSADLCSQHCSESACHEAARRITEDVARQERGRTKRP
ncbi:MAG: tetratricopeptide repeat protein [Phycisphaerae bacterium]